MDSARTIADAFAFDLVQGSNGRILRMEEILAHCIVLCVVESIKGRIIP